MVTLGDKVRDSITGFSGVAVSRTEYLHGCPRVGVISCQLNQGQPIECQYFEEARLETKMPAKVYGLGGENGGLQA